MFKTKQQNKSKGRRHMGNELSATGFVFMCLIARQPCGDDDECVDFMGGAAKPQSN